MGTLNKSLAVTFILVVLASSLLVIESANSQSPTNPSLKEFSYVSSGSFSLVPEASRIIYFQLRENDTVEGNFTETDFHYYPNYYIGGRGELITYPTSVTIHDSKQRELYKFYPATEGSFNFTAKESGVYTIDYFCSYLWGLKDPIPPKATFNFTVHGLPMKIDVSSPISQTYTTSNISQFSLPLNFTTNRIADWMGYSLDEQRNITFWQAGNGTRLNIGNSTISGLIFGEHTVAVFVNDTYGNIDSQTVAFIVKQPESFLTVFLVLALTAIVTVGVIFLVYRKRRKALN